MKNIKRLMIITCIALMGAMQATAVTYKPYKPQKSTYGQPMPVGYATAPTTTFYSTSAMQGGRGTYTSTLNANGTVKASAYGVGMSGPRRIGGAASPGEEDDEGGGTGLNQEAHDDERENGTPIGDAVVPLMLLACAYLIWCAARKRKDDGMNVERMND